MTNRQIDNAKYLDAVMSMYNLIKYSDNYSKFFGNLWKCYRDKRNDALIVSESFKSQVKITENTLYNDNTKDLKIAVPFKYLSTFRKTLEILSVNCEINPILTWSADCVISPATRETK